MRKSILSIAAIVLAVGLAIVPRLNSSAQTGANQWPTFHADIERSGSVAASGAASFSPPAGGIIEQWGLSCANAAGNPIPCLNPYNPALRGSLVIDANGAAYAGAETGRVYDFDPTYAKAHSGQAKWSFLASSPIDSTSSLSNDGTKLYVADTNGDVYALKTADGTAIWGPVNVGGPVTAPTLLSPDGTQLYVPQINGTLTALNAATGTANWHFNPGQGAMPGGVATDISGTILYIEVGTYLYAVPSGGPGTGGGVTLAGYLSANGAGTPSVDANGNIYVGTVLGTLESFSPGNATSRWRYQAPCSGSIASTPAFVQGATGNLVVFGSCSPGGYGALRALDQATGNQIWQVAGGPGATGPAGPVNSSPAVARGNKMIYFGSQDNKLYGVDNAGNIVTTANLGSGVDSSPAIAADGSIWVGTNGGAVYRLGTLPLPPTPQPTSTATPTPIFTPTPTSTPTPTVTPTPVQIPLSEKLAKATVKPGQKQTVTITSAPNTVVHIRVNYPNGDHQSHSVTTAAADVQARIPTNAAGVATYTYKQGASKIKHNNRKATVIASAGSGASANTVQSTYTIAFGTIDVSAEPRSAAPGKVVDIFVHAKPGSNVIAVLLGPSGKVVTKRGKTGPKGFASIKYTVERSLVTKLPQKVTIVAKFANGSTASTKTTFTVK